MPEGGEEEEDKRRFHGLGDERPGPKYDMKTIGYRLREPNFEPREPGSRYPTNSPAPVIKRKRKSQ
jgi:hypothetical protein